MKKKLLITYNYILHYRKPLFNLLCDTYDVTVLHSGEKSVLKNDKFKEIIVPVKKIGPFFLQSKLITEVKNIKYDAIIALFDPRWLSTLLAYYLYNKNAKLIFWGAWLTKNYFINKTRLYFTKNVDASIFYTYKSKLDFIKLGVNKENLFVANNTFDVGGSIKSYKNKIKNRILFVGSLDNRKQNDILIRAFLNIKKNIPNDIILTIIGDGYEMKKLKRISDTNLNKRIQFLGRINDIIKLKEYYKESIVSVSFGQAGLSVLQSLGYGVPFLTKINAISGGEKTNIKHGYNSFFCEDNIDSLQNQLIYCCNNISEVRKIGENAYNYYNKYCRIENMSQGFIDSIENTNLSIIDKSIN